MISQHPALLRPQDSVLVVIDVQESLLNAISNASDLLKNLRLLLRGARTIGIPLLVTTQNRPKLGSVVEALTDLLPPSQEWIDKLCFSCANSDSFRAALESLKSPQVVLCGVETHICVCQTALGLLALGHQVHVVADATSARSAQNHEIGLRKMLQAGAYPCSTEMALYEWMGQAGTTTFREVLRHLKA